MMPRAGFLAVLLLAACGSAPTTRFHSLLPADAAPVTAPSLLPARPAWELLPVRVPAQVDQPQMLVRLADDTLVALEQDRWAAPLADEIRAGVAARLAQAALPADDGTSWRIGLVIERFESSAVRGARLDAQWTLQRAGQAVALRCRAAFEEPAGAGAPALAAGHRAAVARLGDAVAASLRSLAAGGTARC